MTRTDISDIKRAAAERERLLAAEQAARLSLADQTERLDCLITNAIPGILFTDEEGRITHVNQSFATLHGLESPDHLVGTAVAGYDALGQRQLELQNEKLRELDQVIDNLIVNAVKFSGPNRRQSGRAR